MTFARQTTTTDDMMTRYWPWGVRDSIIRSPEEEAMVPCAIDPKTGQDMGVMDNGIGRKMIDVLVDRQREDRVFTHLLDTIAYLGIVHETPKSPTIFPEGSESRRFSRESTVLHPGSPGRRSHALRWASPPERRPG